MKTLHIAGRSIQVVSHFKNLEELSEQLKTFSYRVLKEECLDLPPKIYIKRGHGGKGGAHYNDVTMRNQSIGAIAKIIGDSQQKNLKEDQMLCFSKLVFENCC